MASKDLKAELREWYECYTKKMKSQLRILVARMKNLRDSDKTLDEGGQKMIHKVTSRIKTFDSAYNKLLKKGKKTTKEEFMSLTDLAGLRIVVNYKDYIEKIHELIEKQPGIEITEVIDYVNKPKDSGYRALHLVVMFTNHGSQTPVEIQIRSPLEDLWAEYEHDIQYKAPRSVSDDVSGLLKKLADSFDRNENRSIIKRDNDYRQLAKSKSDNNVDQDAHQ